jgi:mRNA interferase MazF
LQTTKRRPALVVQSDGLASQLSQVIIAMISSNMARVGPPFRVAIPMNSTLSRGSGLRSDSVVMLDNLATILDRLIDRKIGSLSDMVLVDAALRAVLAL